MATESDRLSWKLSFQMLAFYKDVTFSEEEPAKSYISFLEPLEILRMKDFVLAVERKDLRRAVEATEKLIEFLDETEAAFVDYIFDCIPNPSGY